MSLCFIFKKFKMFWDFIIRNWLRSINFIGMIIKNRFLFLLVKKRRRN